MIRTIATFVVILTIYHFIVCTQRSLMTFQVSSNKTGPDKCPYLSASVLKSLRGIQCQVGKVSSTCPLVLGVSSPKTQPFIVPSFSVQADFNIKFLYLTFHPGLQVFYCAANFWSPQVAHSYPEFLYCSFNFGAIGFF